MVTDFKWVDMSNYRNVSLLDSLQSVANNTNDILEISEGVLNNEFWVV